jgi:hypothetical protein
LFRSFFTLPRLRRLAYTIGYTSVTAVTVALVFVRFIVAPGIDGYPPAMFTDMVYGTAYRPYVTRALMPVLIRAATALIPPAIQAQIEATPWGPDTWR